MKFWKGPFGDNTDVVGAFVTYEKNNDIKRIQTQFDRRNKDKTRPRLAKTRFSSRETSAADPSNINWKNMQIPYTSKKFFLWGFGIKLSERFVRGADSSSF